MTDTILMCEPTEYNIQYEINPWMQGNVGLVDEQLATRQWNDLANIIAKHAAIKLVKPQPNLPDMVFTANASFVFYDGSKWHSIMSKFRNEQRTGEEPFFIDWFNRNGFLSYFPPDELTFEGAGDCLMSDYITAWVGFGFRSTYAAAQYISHTLDTFNIRTRSLRLTDDRFYHLDTCFCPLSDGYVLYFPDAFEQASVSNIKSHFGNRAIAVDELDALMFACNAVNIDNYIIVNKMSTNLKKVLNDRGFDVIETGLSEFMKSGGSAKCLTLKI